MGGFHDLPFSLLNNWRKYPPHPTLATLQNLVLSRLSGHSEPLFLNHLMLPFDTQVCHEHQICLRCHRILKVILQMAFSAHRTQIWKCAGAWKRGEYSHVGMLSLCPHTGRWGYHNCAWQHAVASNTLPTRPIQQELLTLHKAEQDPGNRTRESQYITTPRSLRQSQVCLAHIINSPDPTGVPKPTQGWTGYETKMRNIASSI